MLLHTLPSHRRYGSAVQSGCGRACCVTLPPQVSSRPLSYLKSTRASSPPLVHSGSSPMQRRLPCSPARPRVPRRTLVLQHPGFPVIISSHILPSDCYSSLYHFTPDHVPLPVLTRSLLHHLYCAHMYLCFHQVADRGLPCYSHCQFWAWRYCDLLVGRCSWCPLARKRASRRTGCATRVASPPVDGTGLV